MNPKDLEFKAEDFVHASYLIDGNEFIHIKDAAMVANHLLREWLEDTSILAGMRAENEKLRSALFDLTANLVECPRVLDIAEKRGKEIEQLKTKLAQAEEVLKRYAEANYQLDVSQEGIKAYLKRAYNDCGHRARARLKEWGIIK